MKPIAATLAVCAAQTIASAAAPNIVLIYADDLGYGELGCYGQEKIQTPHIDALAQSGVRLARFYAGAPVCAPSRCSLMTGKSLYRAPIRDNTEAGGWGPEEPEGQRPLADAEVTIAETLRDAGYATAAFGKWGLGGPGSEGHPCNQGFDHFYGYLCQRVAHSYYPTHLWRNHDVDVQHGNRYFASHQRFEGDPADPDAFDRYKGEDYAPTEIRREMLGWIREQESDDATPFFVYFPSVIPHVALHVPDDRLDRYPESWDEGPYLGDRGYTPHPRPRAAYAAMISELDDAVGELVATLRELDEHNNTLIILTSDNGPTHHAGGADTAFFESAGGLRGYKGSVFEGGLRVPLVASWPGRIPEDTESFRPAGTQDLMATFCDAAGVLPPAAADSVTMLPSLEGQRQPPREFLFWEFHGYGGQQAIISGDWKLVRQDLKREPGPLMLFNLRRDPGETTDLAEQHPETVRELSRLMERHREPSSEYRFESLGD